MTAFLVAVPGGVRLTLHIQPRAARTELAGLHGGALKLRVAAPPVDGAANRELVRYLASCLDVPRSRLELVAGAGARRKGLLVHGMSLAEARDKLDRAGQPLR